MRLRVYERSLGKVTFTNRLFEMYTYEIHTKSVLNTVKIAARSCSELHQGLGKTCQTISFLAHLFEQNKRLMHLIVVPPSTLDNWVREISVWCPDFNFTVYQGNMEERRQLRHDVLSHNFERHLNAILTTYGMISSTSEDKVF